MPKTLQEIVMKVETDPDWVGEGNVDQAIKRLQTKGSGLGIDLRVMDGEQLALSRMSYGKDSDFSTTSLWVPNDHLYGNTKEADILVVDKKHSLIFRSPEKATSAHARAFWSMKGREFGVKGDYDRLRQLASPDASEALKTGVLSLSRASYRRDTTAFKHEFGVQHIDTDSFGDNNLTVFIFGEETAANYGRWLKEEEKARDIVHFVVGGAEAAKQREPFARALWVHKLAVGQMYLDGVYPNLANHYGLVRGVKHVPAERAAPQAPQ